MGTDKKLVQDIRDALRYFLAKTESLTAIAYPVRHFLGLEDGQKVLVEWAENCRFPGTFIQSIPDSLARLEYPRPEKMHDLAIDNFWERAKANGWQPNAVKLPKNAKPKKDQPVKASKEDWEWLPSSFVSRDGNTYWHRSMKKKEFPFPEDDLQTWIDDKRFILCMEAEIEPVETIEFVTEGQGRSPEQIRVCYKVKLTRDWHTTICFLQPEDLSKPESFSKLLIGKKFTKWKAEKIYFEWFVDWLIRSEVPHVREMPHWGQIEPGVFLFENGIFDGPKNAFYPADDEYRTVWKGKSIVCPSGGAGFLPPVYSAPNENDVMEMEETLALWESINGLLNVRTLVSYAIASLFSHDIIKSGKWSKGFPMAFAYGEAGTGKSSALDLLMRMFGYSQGNRQAVSKDSSLKGLNRKMTKVHTFPFYMDDFRDHSKPGYKNVPDFTQSMLNYYHHQGGVIAQKTADNSTMDYAMNCSLIWTGNDLPPDPAARMRCVLMYFNRKLSRDDLPKLARLELRADTLSVFIPLILSRYYDVKKEFYGRVEEHFRTIHAHRLESRVSHHWAYIFAAHDTYMRLFNRSWDLDREQFQQEALAILIAEQNRTNEDVPLNRFWEALDYFSSVSEGYLPDAGRNLYAIDKRTTRLIQGWRHEDGREFATVLAIHLPDVWNKLAAKHAPIVQDVNISNLDYLIERSPYFIKRSHQVRFKMPDGKEVGKRAYLFNADEMRQLHLMPSLFYMLSQPDSKMEEYERSYTSSN